MIGAILSGAASLAGLGMSLAQMQEAKRLRQDAENAAAQAANAFRNIREKNPYAAIQVPTMGYELAQQGIDRAAMSALSTAQGAGVEGVIGAVPGIVGGTAAASLQQQAGLQEAEYNRNLAQAEAQQGIEARKAEREKEFYDAQLTGAQAAARQAEINRQNAIEGAVKSGASALGSFGEAIPLFFGNKEVESIPGVTSSSAPSGTTTGVNAMGQQMSYAPGYIPFTGNDWKNKSNLYPYIANGAYQSLNNRAKTFGYMTPEEINNFYSLSLPY
jgi:hypothetical protein